MDQHWIDSAAWPAILRQFVSFLIVWLIWGIQRVFGESTVNFRMSMESGASSFLIQPSIVVVTVVSNLLLIKYSACSVYGVDIPWRYLWSLWSLSRLCWIAIDTYYSVGIKWSRWCADISIKLSGRRRNPSKIDNLIEKCHFVRSFSKIYVLIILQHFIDNSSTLIL